VVGWASLSSLVANTFLGFFFAPLVGDLSDRMGRKPFMVAGVALAALPVGAVWLHLTYYTSFLW
jgi:MFS family permease